MTVSLQGLGAITLFVEHLERSRSFYEDVFGLRLTYEDEEAATFDFGNTLINLARDPSGAHADRARRRRPSRGGSARPAHDLGRRRGRRLRATGRARCGAAERAGRPRVGSAHRLLHRPRRQSSRSHPRE